MHPALERWLVNGIYSQLDVTAVCFGRDWGAGDNYVKFTNQNKDKHFRWCL
jgi:hypothetical protein